MHLEIPANPVPLRDTELHNNMQLVMDGALNILKATSEFDPVFIYFSESHGVLPVGLRGLHTRDINDWTSELAMAGIAMNASSFCYAELGTFNADTLEIAGFGVNETGLVVCQLARPPDKRRRDQLAFGMAAARLQRDNDDNVLGVADYVNLNAHAQDMLAAMPWLDLLAPSLQRCSAAKTRQAIKRLTSGKLQHLHPDVVAKVLHPSRGETVH